MARHCSPLKKIDKKLQISLPKALPVSGLKSSKKTMQARLAVQMRD